MIQLTTKQYAAARGIWDGAVRKAIKLGSTMEGVIDTDKFGKSHLIYVSKEFYDKNKKKIDKIR